VSCLPVRLDFTALLVIAVTARDSSFLLGGRWMARLLCAQQVGMTRNFFWIASW
jgi:hypothetical protein